MRKGLRQVVWNSTLPCLVLMAVMGLAGCVKTAPPAGGAKTNPGTTVTPPPPNGGTVEATPPAKLSGAINIEGSSTVFPISQAMSREFEGKHPDVQVPVAGNGTSAGFKKFLTREIDICDASRPITESEQQKCRDKQVEYVELQVAIDGLTVVVNKENDFAETITVAELKKIWDQDSRVKKWSEVREGWPDEAIELFGAGTDSGTFDYFTEAINGTAKRSRSDYSASENDNILVSGVSNNKYAMGYFGFAYYVTAAGKLKALKIAVEEGAAGVAPTPQTVEDGSYKPLSRPLFIYVNKDSLQKPEVAEFVKFYLSDEGQKIVESRKYVRINAEVLKEMRQRLQDALAK